MNFFTHPHRSSRELGIEGSSSFLCLFILSISQRCPKLHKNSPPQGPSVFPWASLSVLILESREQRYVFCWALCCIVSLCQGFCPKVETLLCLRALVFCHHVAVAFSDGLPSCSFQLIALFGM